MKEIAPRGTGDRFSLTANVDVHLPFSRDSQPLRKDQATPCLPAEDKGETSFLAQSLPKTEHHPGNLGDQGARDSALQFTYVFAVKTV